MSHSQPLQPIKRIGPLCDSKLFKDLKDPCIVFDGVTWHIYGSGGTTITETWVLCHSTAPHIEGPWSDPVPVTLRGLEGPHIAAPSVMYDPEDTLYHMVVQKDFMNVGEGIIYLVSSDGETFTKMRTLLQPTGKEEAGLYDPHFSIVNGKKYIAYSGVPELVQSPIRPYIVPQPDIYIARSETDLWAGPWTRLQSILKHEDIAWHHNNREHPDYEWGIEGPQLVELPNGQILLNATCFIEEGRRGTRQRVFFALADTVQGPYNSIGPVLPTALIDLPEWENGENGHASAIVYEDNLYLFYQARSQKIVDPKEANDFRFGLAVFAISDILAALKKEEDAS